MSNLMKERMARAICWANCPRTMSDEDKTCHTESAWDMWLPEVDAALDALREPTEGMEDAGVTEKAFGPGDLDITFYPGEVWIAMIDAIKEGA
mgnify:CR=1 FL=1